MLTRLFYAFHGVLYAALIYFGFYYLEIDQALLENYFEVGWDNYEGPSLSSPEKAYYPYWMMASIFSLGIVFTTKRDKDATYSKLELFLLGFSIFCFCVYGIFYSLGGDVSMKESRLAWIFTGVMHIVLSIMLLYENNISKTMKIAQKQFYGLNGLGYLALLGLGFYYYQWDLDILKEIKTIGTENYNGPDRDDPENTYHLILMVTTVLSLVIGFFDQANKVKNALTVYKTFFVVYFLYSGFVYINDGNPDMEETFYWWVILALLGMGISFVFYKETEDKLPEKEPIYKDDILDDLSSLE